MNKGYELIIKSLKEFEEIIYQTDKNFKFGESNAVINGEKILCITNFGRIIIVDKEKKFKIIKTVIYDFSKKNIKFKVLTKNDIIAINSRDFSENLSERFILNMKMDDFVNLYKKLELNPFIIEWSKYILNIDEQGYESAIIDLREDYISCNTTTNKENIYYKEICKCKLEENLLKLELNNGNNKFEVYNFNMPIIDLYNFIKEKIKHIEIATCEYEDELEMNNKEIEIDLNKSNKLDNDDKKDLDFKLNLNAILNGVDYKQKEIEVKLGESFKIINKDTQLEILDIEFSEFQYLKLKDIFIINYKNNVISISGEVDNLESEKMKIWAIENEVLGYNENLQGFLVNIEYEYIRLMQSDDNVLDSIKLSDIADISILESKFNFDKIAITLKNSTTIKLNIFNKSLINLMKKIYLFKKSNIYKNSTIDTMYNEFLYVVADRLKLYYFTDFISVKNMIDEYYSNEYKSKNSLLNNLYGKIYAQKFILENISMYFLEGIKIFNNYELTYLGKVKVKVFKEELIAMQEELAREFSDILKELESLDIFKNKSDFASKSSMIRSDFIEYLNKIGINTEYLLTKEYIFYKEISGTDFDIIINNINRKIDYFINLKIPYYIKYIDTCISSLNYKVLNINTEDLSKELKVVLFDIITEFYIEKQYNSKSFSKCTLKKIIDKFNKLNVLSNDFKKCREKSLFTEILD